MCRKRIPSPYYLCLLRKLSFESRRIWYSCAPWTKITSEAKLIDLERGNEHNESVSLTKKNFFSQIISILSVLGLQKLQAQSSVGDLTPSFATMMLSGVLGVVLAEDAGIASMVTVPCGRIQDVRRMSQRWL